MSEYVVAGATTLSAVASVLTAVIYWRLFKVAQDQVQATILASNKQIDNANQAAKMQTYVQVTNQLSLDRDFRADRLVLQNHEQGTAWSGDESEAAFRVCAALNVAAVLAYEGAIPKDLFVKQYGRVLCKTAKQTESVVPQSAYADFRRLTKEAEVASLPNCA